MFCYDTMFVKTELFLIVKIIYKSAEMFNFDVKRRKKHLIHVHQRILLEAVFARNKSASRPPVFLLVMLGYSSTIPETEKTTVLWEAHLHTHKKTNNLICSDSWNWWSLHLPKYLPKILTWQNPPLKAFLYLMRKEDPYLLEVWVLEDHLNGERVS